MNKIKNRNSLVKPVVGFNGIELVPNVLRGGRAINNGDGTFTFRGRTHKTGGIDVGNIEVEDEEIGKSLSDGGMAILSAHRRFPSLRGVSPAEYYQITGDFDTPFILQETDKQMGRVNNSKRKAAKGALFTPALSVPAFTPIATNINTDTDGAVVTPAVADATPVVTTDTPARHTTKLNPMPIVNIFDIIRGIRNTFSAPKNTIEEITEEAPYYPSENIVRYLKETEAFRPNVYLDGNGVETIGYGTTAATKAGQRAFAKYRKSGMTEQQASDVMHEVIREMVPSFINSTPNFNKLNNNERDALFSYFYNVGIGNYTTKSPGMQKALRDLNREQIMAQMDIGYNDSKNPGLRKRRDKERAIFATPVDTTYENGGIHIDKNKRGTFTAAATKHGMGVQQFASKVLANKEDYSPAMVKKANFARNAAKWKASSGGIVSITGNVKNGLIYANGGKTKYPDGGKSDIDGRYSNGFVYDFPAYAEYLRRLGYSEANVRSALNTAQIQQTLGLVEDPTLITGTGPSVGMARATQAAKTAANVSRASRVTRGTTKTASRVSGRTINSPKGTLSAADRDALRQQIASANEGVAFRQNRITTPATEVKISTPTTAENVFVKTQANPNAENAARIRNAVPGIRRGMKKEQELAEDIALDVLSGAKSGVNIPENLRGTLDFGNTSERILTPYARFRDYETALRAGRALSIPRTLAGVALGSTGLGYIANRLGNRDSVNNVTPELSDSLARVNNDSIPVTVPIEETVTPADTTSVVTNSATPNLLPASVVLGYNNNNNLLRHNRDFPYPTYNVDFQMPGIIMSNPANYRVRNTSGGNGGDAPQATNPVSNPTLTAARATTPELNEVPIGSGSYVPYSVRRTLGDARATIPSLATPPIVPTGNIDLATINERRAINNTGRLVPQMTGGNSLDYITAGANALGTILGAIGTNMMINRTPKVPIPVSVSGPKLKTNYNINPQLDEAERQQYRSFRDIDRNSASSSVALARKRGVSANTLATRNNLYGTKENYETQLINQDRIYDYQARRANANAYNNYLTQRFNRDYNRLNARISNFNNALSNLSSIGMNLADRIENRRAFNRNLMAIAMSNPNVDARNIFGPDSAFARALGITYVPV